MKHWKPAAVAVIALAVVAAFLWWPRGYCREARSRYGLEIPVCPDGRMRQQVAIEADGLRRTGPGTVTVTATGLYAVSTADEINSVPITSFDTELALVDGAGAETPLEVKEWKRRGRARTAEVTLPEVADGDYQLRATVTSKVETTTVDLPLALYAPAKIHLLTDRPLYEPGNVVQFRALAVRAGDLSPIDGRAGIWEVVSPAGEVLLEEKAPAGAWGVVAGSFPLDRGAETGDWTVRWRSGDAVGSRTFRVAPFTLPRFKVEASADRRFYRPGDRPVVKGAVTYSSGAPVGGAAVEVDWSISADRWPPPTDWTDGGLPTRAVTGADGSFELALPEVPDDLIGQARLAARIAAVDPAGDRVVGSAGLLLSEDAIKVAAMTELEGGLVKGFNNRLYLRVTTADGRPLPGAQVKVTRAWQPGDDGIDAELDADSVARIQVDPGDPVTVTIPAPPWRAPPKGDVVTRVGLNELLRDGSAPIADQIAMEKWHAALEACAVWASGGATSRVVAQVAASGAVGAVARGSSDLDQCVARVVERGRLPAGDPRMYDLQWRFSDDHLPSIAFSTTAPVGAPADIDEAIARAATALRGCLSSTDDADTYRLSWRARAKSPRLELRRIDSAPPAVARCLDRGLVRIDLDEPADADSLGVVDLSVTLAPAAGRSRKPQPTVMLGYELRVEASLGSEGLGTTTLRMEPGNVPPLRIRATPVLAKPGETIAIELLRGPDFTGDVPEKLWVDHLGKRDELEVDQKKRTASLKLPDDARGWYVIADEYRSYPPARVFVRSAEELAVEVTPEAKRYAPGDSAKLAIQTTIGGRGARAAVGLFGVDESLAQLVALPGPDDLGELRPPIEMTAPAFGLLEAQALALGRIRGSNAAEAVIMSVSQVPQPADVDVVASGAAVSQIDPIADLTDRFYPVLDQLHLLVRAWERDAPDGEQMTPARMAKLWNAALDATAKAGGSIEDSYGRRLRLHRLPMDLLALTDPRQVVVVGTRLPEDVENWPAWVRENRP